MKPWLREALICMGWGAGIVGGILGLGMLLGAKVGPCGPVNGAAVFEIVAMLPGLLAGGFINECLGNETLATTTMFVTLVGSYSVVTFGARRLFRRGDDKKPAYR